MSEAPSVPNRRWFRFSLRAFLIAMAVLGCWLGYQVNWISQRRVVIAESPKWTGYEGDESGPNSQPTAPGLLWLFGEKGYSGVTRIVVVDDLDDALSDSWPPEHVEAELQRVRKLFPEAVVAAAPIPGI